MSKRAESTLPSASLRRDGSAGLKRNWLFMFVGLCLPSLITYGYFYAASDESAGFQQLAISVGKSIQFALPILWYLCFRRGVEASDPGFGKAPHRSMLYGVAFAMATVLSMLTLYHGWLKHTAFFGVASEQIRDKVTSLGVDTPGMFMLLAALYVIVHSLLEEYYFRWFLFRGLDELTGFGVAIVISSLGFMAHHVVVLSRYFGVMSPATWLLSVCVAVGGAFWAWLYRRTGNLGASWLSHAIIDAGIFLIGFSLLRETF